MTRSFGLLCSVRSILNPICDFGLWVRLFGLNGVVGRIRCLRKCIVPAGIVEDHAEGLNAFDWCESENGYR